MDPYLESHWEDVHPRLVVYVRDELEPHIPEDLVGKICTSAIIDEPIRDEPVSDPIHQRSVLILDPEIERIITAIEILSPWNKLLQHSIRAYLERREQYIGNNVNLVEIDLIRAGDWTDMIGPYNVPDWAATTYRVTVVTPEAPGPYHYRIPIRSKLPTVTVPLRPQDAPAKLNLQSLIEKAYVMGLYDLHSSVNPPDEPCEQREKQDSQKPSDDLPDPHPPPLDGDQVFQVPIQLVRRWHQLPKHRRQACGEFTDADKVRFLQRFHRRHQMIGGGGGAAVHRGRHLPQVHLFAVVQEERLALLGWQLLDGVKNRNRSGIGDETQQRFVSTDAGSEVRRRAGFFAVRPGSSDYLRTGVFLLSVHRPA
jgi:hypothetical protein